MEVSRPVVWDFRILDQTHECHQSKKIPRLFFCDINPFLFTLPRLPVCLSKVYSVFLFIIALKTSVALTAPEPSYCTRPVAVYSNVCQLSPVTLEHVIQSCRSTCVTGWIVTCSWTFFTLFCICPFLSCCFPSCFWFSFFKIFLGGGEFSLSDVWSEVSLFGGWPNIFWTTLIF